MVAYIDRVKDTPGSEHQVLFPFCSSEGWGQPSQEATHWGDSARGHPGTSPQRIWDVEDRIWTDACCQWASRYDVVLLCLKTNTTYPPTPIRGYSAIEYLAWFFVSVKHSFWQISSSQKTKLFTCFIGRPVPCYLTSFLMVRKKYILLTIWFMTRYFALLKITCEGRIHFQVCKDNLDSKAVILKFHQRKYFWSSI